MLATRHMSSSPLSRTRRVAFFNDSTRERGVVVKVRSSLVPINNIRRMIAVDETAAYVQILPHCVSSKLYPAEEPSRDAGVSYRNALGRFHLRKGSGENSFRLKEVGTRIGNSYRAGAISFTKCLDTYDPKVEKLDERWRTLEQSCTSKTEEAKNCSVSGA